MNKLTTEEKQLLDAYHDGKLERVALSPLEIEGYREAARAVSRKSHRVNIRMSAADLRDLKIRALSEGMPYQTLMASVLHKFVTG
jgi:predicted DNA binding CopG/RHH family protein